MEVAVYRGIKIPRSALSPVVRVDDAWKAIGFHWHVAWDVDFETGAKIELPPGINLGDKLEGTEITIEESV